MKGFTHYLTGITAATFFLWAVRSAALEKSLIILLGGFAGILADTLDFRINKYLYRHHYEVDMYEGDLDPRIPLNALLRAMRAAWETGRRINIKFHTIKLSSDRWRQYSILIDEETRIIRVRIGPIVTTGQVPFPGTEPPEERAVAEVVSPYPIKYGYDKEINVDIFSGPDFDIYREGDHLVFEFLPWHRQWSHSITMGLLLAPLGFLIYGFGKMGWVAFWIIAVGYWTHILTDHFGLMGSNLFPPFTRKRVPGFHVTRSMSKPANIYTNYTNAMLILWNLNAFSPSRIFTLPLAEYAYAKFGTFASWYFFGLVNWVALFILPPILVSYALLVLYRRWYYGPPEVVAPGAERVEEALSESEEYLKG